MPTALQLINTVLLRVGENELSALSTPLGKKALAVLNNSLQFCSQLCEWPHLLQEVSALSWAANVATLPPTHEVKAVVLTGTAPYEVPYARRLASWRQSRLQVLSSGTVLESWGYSGTDKIRIIPQPSAVQQAALRFFILSRPVEVLLAADVVDVPYDFQQLLQLHMMSLLLLEHVGDSQAASITMSNFELQTQQLRTKFSGPSHVSLLR